MKRFTSLFTFVLIALFAISANAQITATSNETMDVSFNSSNYPPSTQYSLDFVSNSANYSVSDTTTSSAIKCVDTRFNVAAVQIRTSTLATGAITSGSFEIRLSAEDDTPTLVPTAYELERGNAADTSVWMSLPTITNYGTYNIPLGGARYIFVKGHISTADESGITRVVEVSFK